MLRGGGAERERERAPADVTPGDRRWPEVEIAILAPTGAEWLGIVNELGDATDVPGLPLPAKLGRIAGRSVLCYATGKGQEKAGTAAQQVLERFRPSIVLLVGIAGGFPAKKVARGDVLVAHVIHSFDYGKLVDGTFKRRPELDMQSDRALLAWAEVAVADSSVAWRDRVHHTRPDGRKPAEFRVHLDCYIASSNKVVDDPDHAFYAEVAGAFTELHGVEMEGIGVGASVRLAQTEGRAQLLMIRGVSDEPGTASPGTEARAQWTKYAVATAAAFARRLIELLPPRDPASPRPSPDEASAPPSRDAASPPSPDEAPAARLPRAARTAVMNFVIERAGPPGRPRPFGGRAEVLEALNDWAQDAAATPYQLVTAPGGRGKSTLLIRWWQQLPASWPAVFVPISADLDTNEPERFLRLLAASLSAALGMAEGRELSVDDARRHIDACLTAPREAATPLIVIVDGLDELDADAWTLWRQLFPLDETAVSRARLRVLVSARPVLGDGDASGWMARLGWSRWHRLSRTPLELAVLDAGGIASVLDAAGLARDAAGGRDALVFELLRLTEGDPLMLSLYVDELSGVDGDGLVTAERLPRIPAGLNGYFGEWLRQIDLGPAAQGRDAARLMRTMLHLLATAFAPLPADDLGRVLTEPERQQSLGVLRDLAPAARFVTGSGRANDGYRFTHPRFRDHFLEADMTAAERAQREQRFLAAGRAQLDELASGAVAPEDASRYFLRHLADHLVRARAPAEDILCLASEARLDAWLAIDPGGRGLLRDLEIASRAAAGLDDRAMASGVPARGIGVELLRGLCAASLRSRAHSMTPVLAVEALRRSLITAERAVDLGMQQEDAGARCDILAALLEAGLDDDLRPAVVEAAHAALGATHASRERWRALAPHLTPAMVESAIARRGYPAWSALRERIPAATIDALLDASDAAGSAQPFDARLFAQLAPVLQPAQRERVLAHIARAPISETLVELLEALLVPGQAVPDPVIEHLASATRAVGDVVIAARCVRVLWPWLLATQRAAELARVVALLGGDDATCTEDEATALVELLPLMDEAAQTKVVDAVRRLPGQLRRLRALGVLRRGLHGALLEQVASSAIGIWVNLRVNRESLLALVPFFGDLPPVLQDFAFDVLTEHVKDYLFDVMTGKLEGLLEAEVCLAFAARAENWRAKAVARAIAAIPRASMVNRAAEIFKHLAPVLTAPEVPAAVTAALAIRHGGARTRALSYLLPRLPESAKDDVIRAAMVSSSEIDDWYELCEVLSALGAAIAPEHVERAAHAVERLASPSLRGHGLAALLGATDPPRRAARVDRVLEEAKLAASGYRLAKLLEVVLPHLSDAQLRPALDLALAIDENDSRSWELGNAVRMVLKMEPAPTRASLVAELARRLGPAVLGDVVDAVAKIPHGWLRCDALVALAPLAAPHLPEELARCAGGIEEAHLRALAFGELLFLLPPGAAKFGRDEVRQLAAQLPPVWQAMAMAPIIALLPDDGCESVVDGLLQHAEGVDDIPRRRRAIKLFGERASPAQCRGALARVLDAVSATSVAGDSRPDEPRRVDLWVGELLEALVPRLDTADRAAADAVIARADRAMSPHDHSVVAAAATPADALQRLRPLLGAPTKRSQLFDELRYAVPAVASLGSDEAVHAAWNAVCYVARRWP